nr:ORF2 [Epsilontorquevirus sp.]
MTKQQKELAWLDLVKKSHSLFCRCHDPIVHLLKVNDLWMYGFERWHTGFEGDMEGGDGGDPFGADDTGDGAEDTGEHGNAGEDALMAAAADEAEEDERSDS